MRRIILAFCAITISSLTGCATPNTLSPTGSTAEINTEARLQKEMAFKRVIKEAKRVKNTAYPILKSNADLCPNTRYTLGIDLWNESIISKNDKNIANILYGLGEVTQIQLVYKNSPASKNGLKIGDKVIAINGIEIPAGKKAFQKINKILNEDKDRKIKLTLNRDGKEFAKHITRDNACAYGVVYSSEDSDINAYADGENIFITRGMLRFVDNDTELALVISHEIAHNAMGHSDKKKTNTIGAGIGGFALDILAAAAGVNTQGAFTDMAMKAGSGAYSVGFEQEADYVGMYFMERAKYKTNNVANFWRRMASENNSSSIRNRSTHPATAERFVSIDKTYKEIQTKKAKKLPLVPEIKKEDKKKASTRNKGLNE